MRRIPMSHQDHGKGRAQPVLQVSAIIVERQVEGRQRPGLGRAAGAAAGGQQDVLKRGQQAQRLEVVYKQDRPAQLRQDDVAHLLPAIGAIDLGGIKHRRGDRLDCRGKQDHAERGAHKAVDQDHRRSRHGRASASSSSAARHPEPAGDGGQKAVVPGEPVPHQDKHHRRQDARQEPDRAERNSRGPRAGRRSRSPETATGPR